MLSKNETKVLVFFARRAAAGNGFYHAKDLTEVTKEVFAKDKPNATANQVASAKLQEIINTLGNLGFVEIHHHPGGLSIKITPEGLRLAKRYNLTAGRITVWCSEYTWLWVILGVIIGLITLLVTVLRG